MAKQESFIKLRGKMGDLSFYKHPTAGYQARTKGGVDAQRIATDPNFKRTRENNAEFGRAASMSKRIRQQLNNLLFNYSDRTMANRLTSLVHRIQKADPDSPRGERTFLTDNSGMLRGFEFNAGAQLGALFSEALPVAYDRLTEEAMLEIPAFNPQVAVTLLQGATHIQFLLVAAELALDEEFMPRPALVESAPVPLIGAFAGETLQLHLPADPNNAVYLMAGIGIYQEVNGQFYTLNNGSFNALTIVQVDQ